MRNIFPEKLRRKWGRETSITCMENCCYVSAVAPCCYLELLDKLQQRICRTLGPSLAASLEPFAHCGNGASSSLLSRYYFGNCSSELVSLCYSWWGLLVILIHYIIFLSPFLDVTRMSISKSFFFCTALGSGILCL